MAITKFEPLPQRYQHLLTEDKYIKVLELAQDFLDDFGEVRKVDDGLIDFVSHDGTDQQRLGLDNLVRILVDEAENNWQGIVNDHFEKLFSATELGFDQGNFDQVKDILSIRIYSDSYFDGIAIVSDLIFKVDFEDTKSTLVFDYPDKFEPVLREHFSKWNVSEELAFSIALQRVNQHEVQIGKKEFENGFDQFSFFSSSYSASYLLDFEQNAKMAIGKFGALVNIPTHGSAFAVPIDQNNIPEIIGDISETINEFYDEDPGAITINYYWYYDKRFIKFQTSKVKDGFTNLHLPDRLIDLLKNS